MSAPAPRPQPEITQSPHRPRHQSGVRGLGGAGLICVIGALLIAGGLIDSRISGVLAIIIGAVVLAFGVALLVGRLPGWGRRSVRAEVRRTPDGVVFEGENLDTTVPWSEIKQFSYAFDGSTLRVWLERTNGQRLPVPTLTRRGLRTESARARALAEVERVSAELAAQSSSVSGPPSAS